MRKLELSPYYPPRARWYSPMFRITDGFRRITWLDRIHLPEGFSLPAFVAALFIPGLAFRLRRARLIGHAVMAGYALLGLVFICWLGYPVANFAFGLMLSLHVTSILFLFSPWLANARLVFRLLMGVCLLVIVGGLFYAPLRAQVQERWLMPLRVNNRVVIVQTFSSAQSVKRGDWVAYSIEAETGARGLRVQSGYGLRPVLAVSGDRVRFTTSACEVNGVPHPREPYMPASGELVVPENYWFIWPNLAINMHGNAAAMVDATMLRLANVEQSQYVGKPSARWFWRRQILQ